MGVSLGIRVWGKNDATGNPPGGSGCTLASPPADSPQGRWPFGFLRPRDMLLLGSPGSSVVQALVVTAFRRSTPRRPAEGGHYERPHHGRRDYGTGGFAGARPKGSG